MNRITQPGGTWGDVFLAGNDLIGCVYDLGRTIAIEFYEFVQGNAILRAFNQLDFGERILFVRADKNVKGHILVMGQGAITGRLQMQSIGGNYENPGVLTYGTHPCDLFPTLDGFRYVVQVTGTEYYDSKDNNYTPLPGDIWGSSQGIIQLKQDGPRWADLVRQSIPEMLYPFDVGNLFVGEGRKDPPHIQILDVNTQKNVFNGVAMRPRAVYDSISNTLCIVSRGPDGVSFLFFNKPLVGLVPPVIIPPIIPPDKPDKPDTPDTNDNGDKMSDYNPVATSDAELQTLADRLEKKYQATTDKGGLNRGPTETFVDRLGQSRWRRDYFFHRDSGSSPDDAWRKINAEINRITGVNGDPNFP